MTKFVFLAVLAVLAIALYSIPSQSAEKGEMKDKDMQNSTGQIKNESKSDRARTAQRKQNERTKIQIPEQPKTEPQPSK